MTPTAALSPRSPDITFVRAVGPSPPTQTIPTTSTLRPYLHYQHSDCIYNINSKTVSTTSTLRPYLHHQTVSRSSTFRPHVQHQQSDRIYSINTPTVSTSSDRIYIINTQTVSTTSTLRPYLHHQTISTSTTLRPYLQHQQLTNFLQCAYLVRLLPQHTTIIQSLRLALFGHRCQEDQLVSSPADRRRQPGRPASRGSAPTHCIENS